MWLWKKKRYNSISTRTKVTKFGHQDYSETLIHFRLIWKIRCFWEHATLLRPWRHNGEILTLTLFQERLCSSTSGSKIGNSLTPVKVRVIWMILMTLKKHCKSISTTTVSNIHWQQEYSEHENNNKRNFNGNKFFIKSNYYLSFH